MDKTTVRYIVFKEQGDWYAVGLELNIVEVGSTAQEAMLLLFEAMQGYLESARKMKARTNILNQSTDKEYEAAWSSLSGTNKASRATTSVFTSGTLNLATVFGGALATA